MPTKYSALFALLLPVLCVACDSASPVAPEGTTLTVTANPNRISTTGRSTIRVQARRPGGQPVFPGTQIFLATDLGSLPASAVTGEQGVAEAELVGSGVTGLATVRVQAGGAEEQTVEVTIGIQTQTLRLQANPKTLREEGGMIDLNAIAWDEQGDVLAGAGVLFSADVGELDSEGALLQTNTDGTVSDKLTVRGRDVNVLSGDSFEVRAESANSGGLVSDSVTIRISRPPRANFNFSVSGLTATFTDTSTGDPTRWLWDFGDGSTSEVRNPSHIYQTAGTYVVALQVRNAAGDDAISRTISVIGGN